MFGPNCKVVKCLLNLETTLVCFFIITNTNIKQFYLVISLSKVLQIVQKNTVRVYSEEKHLKIDL